MKRQLAVATVDSEIVGVPYKMCRTSSQIPNVLICCAFTAVAMVVPLLLLNNTVDGFLYAEFQHNLMFLCMGKNVIPPEKVA